jgi:hypothetical protein
MAISDPVGAMLGSVGSLDRFTIAPEAKDAHVRDP